MNKPCQESHGDDFPTVPELTTEGMQSALRVACATDDPVMQKSWDEITPYILSHLDLLPDEDVCRLFAIPYWKEKIVTYSAKLNPEARERVEHLQPRSTIGRVIHSIRQFMRRLNSHPLPTGVNLNDVEEVRKRFRERSHNQSISGLSERIQLMNEILEEYFGPRASERSIRFYFYYLDEVDLPTIG